MSDETTPAEEEGYLLELHPPTIVEDSNSNARSCSLMEKKSLAEELGLTAFAKTIDTHPNCEAAAAWCHAQGLHPITVEEYALWRRYLPTPYWSDPAHRINKGEDERLTESSVSRVRTFGDYAFHEGVPSTILRRIKTVRAYFVHEIRTPEANKQDPAWFGHVMWPSGKRDIYLLGRWGRDSDPNFLPDLSAVKKIVDAREYGSTIVNVVGFGVLFAAMLAVGAIGAYSIGSWGGLFLGAVPGIFPAYALASVAESVTVSIMQAVARKQLAKSDPELLPLL